MTVTLRSEKVSALTRGELDGNFIEIRNTEIAFNFNTASSADEGVWSYAVRRPFAFKQDLAGSAAIGPSGFTGLFSLEKNGSVVATIQFTDGDVALSGDAFTVAKGDSLVLRSIGDQVFDVIAVTLLAEKL